MADISLESLGLTEETLADRLVDKLAQHMLASLQYSEEDGEWYGESRFANRLSGQVSDRLNKIVDDLGQKHILPRVSEMVENLTIQQTNQWGEKRGESMTFIEYLTQRADHWLREEVSYDGKAKSQSDYNWRKNGTRVEHMVNSHLQYAVSTAMKNAVDAANKTIIGGLEQAVKIKLGEIAVQLKTEVKSK